jgi:hypothetical protein
VPVVLDHLRVVDRDVGGALVEVLDRVAPLGHHRLDQAVGARDSPAWVVDELRLHSLPALQITVAGCLGERLDLELLPAFFARLQLGLRVTLRIGLAERALVFGAELLLQPACPPARQRLPDDHCKDGNNGDGDQHPYP